MEWFNKYIGNDCADIGHSFEHSSIDIIENLLEDQISKNKPDFNGETFSDVCKINTPNWSCGDAWDPNSKKFNDNNIQPRTGDNKARLICENAIPIKTDDDDPEEGEVKIENVTTLANRNSPRSTTALLPVSEESDVDLLYSYYTCVSPGTCDDPLFKEIKTEPWIEVSTFPGVMPGVKLEDVTGMGHSSTTSDRELMIREYNEAIVCTEQKPREDILFGQSDYNEETTSSGPLFVPNDLRPDDNLPQRNFLKATTRMESEIPITNWQPVVKLERLNGMFPSETIKKDSTFYNGKMTNVPGNIQSTLIGSFVDDNVRVGKDHVRPSAASYRRKNPNSKVKTARRRASNSSQSVAKARVVAPDFAFENIPDDNSALGKVALNTECETESIRATECNSFETPVAETRGEAPEIALENSVAFSDPAGKGLNSENKIELSIAETNLVTSHSALENNGDDVETGSRPKRHSAMKAIQKLQETIQEEVNDIIPTEDSDYEASDVTSSDDDLGAVLDNTEPATKHKIAKRRERVDTSKRMSRVKWSKKKINSSRESPQTSNKPQADQDTYPASKTNGKLRKTRFFCAICCRYFVKDGMLKRHNFLNHGKLPENVKLQKCNICGRKFFYEEQLKQHQYYIHKKEPKTGFCCGLCRRYYVREGKLHRHNLLYHRKIPENVKLQKCNICTRQFFNQTQLKKHQLVIHQKIFKRKMYPCDICKQKFIYNGKMLLHKKAMHSGDRTCVCEVCGQVFMDGSKLNVHMYNHNKGFKCDICNTFWSTIYNLKTHMLSHTGEKPHKCEVCQQTFSRIDNLKLHLKLMHKEVLRYECKKCHKKFKTNKEKVEHGRETHAQKQEYKKTECELCGKMLSGKQVKAHNRLHQEGRIMKCDQCGKHVKLTQKRYKYKIAEKDDKTVCHACLEEYAKTFKPGEYDDIRRRCQIKNRCQHCDKYFRVGSLKRKHHEAMCRENPKTLEKCIESVQLTQISKKNFQSEKVSEDKSLAATSIDTEEEPIPDA